MWIEVAAIRHLESHLRGSYAQIGEKAVLTDWVYAPECKGRIDDTTKDFVLDRYRRSHQCGRNAAHSALVGSL